MRDPRLGDDIDDFCVRCKRVMNHAVVSVLDNKPAKVRCRTCHSDHDFRNEQPPPPKVDLRKQALFTEVLKKVSPGAAAPPDDLDPELVLEAGALDTDDGDAESPDPDLAAEAEAEVESEAPAGVELETVAAPPPATAAPSKAPKPKAKAKPKPKVKATRKK